MRRTQKDVDSDVEHLRKKLQKPRTMMQLTDAFGVDRTTIYRWFRLLEDEGVRVQREGVSRPTKFYLA